jgi:hypothetical protein
MNPLQWVYSDIAAERRQVSLRMLFSAVHFLIYKKRQSNSPGVMEAEITGFWAKSSSAKILMRKKRLCGSGGFPLLHTNRFKSVFLNRRAAAQYRTLASIIPDRERFSWN